MGFYPIRKRARLFRESWQKERGIGSSVRFRGEIGCSGMADWKRFLANLVEGEEGVHYDD